MPSVDSSAPLLSIRGTLAAVRKPTAQNILFSAKTTLASALCLFVAFNTDLVNPYWSALTVYVLAAQPQAGTVRARSVFRIVGTFLGGAAAVLLAAMFASDIGVLLGATIGAIVVVTYVKALDRTPGNYTWFVTALTLAVVGIAQVQVPDTIFAFATTRMVEIGLAVLVTGLIDSIVLPRAATPDFLRSMTDWRDRATQWIAPVLSADALETPEAYPQRQQDLKRLAALLGPLDAFGSQLPYDIVPVPPSGQDMRFIQLTVAHLVALLAAADLWTEAIQGGHTGAPDIAQQSGEVRAWLLERSTFDDPMILDHALRGEVLRDRLAAHVPDVMALGGADDRMRATTLLRFSEFVDHWSRLERTLYAIATGTRTAPALRLETRRARPVRSTDYMLGLLDAAPMALALGSIAALWYATNWTSAISAMLFAFISLGVVGGTPGALRSAQGMVLWIALACVMTLVYQFAILPRITAFPMLIAALVISIVPLSLLMTMSPAGLLILANGLALIGLQNAYAADFGASLEALLGALTGCVIAVAALHLCRFDRARFSSRRLASALRRDLRDMASAVRTPRLDRLVSLGIDRIALHTTAVAALPEGDPLRRDDLVSILRIAVDLMGLRAEEKALPPAGRAPIDALRVAICSSYGDRFGPDLSLLRARTESACNALLGEPPSASRTKTLAALTGLRAVFSFPAGFANARREAPGDH